MREIVLAKVYENEELRKEYCYPIDWRYEMMEPLIITVFAPYEIMEHEGQNYIISTSYKEVFKEGHKGIGGKNSHELNPFEVEKLLIEALKVDTSDEKSILDFCNKYGVLGEVRSELGPAGFLGLGGYNINFNSEGRYERLDYFIKNIEKLKWLFHLYLITKERDKTALTQYWNTIILNSLKYIETSIEENKREGQDAIVEMLEKDKKERIKSMKNPPPIEEILENALANLVGDLNDGLTDVFLNLRVKGSIQQYNFIEGMTSTTLKGVLYYQLYNHLVKGNQFKKCEYCGSYFTPRKTDARFCPSDDPNEHGKCQNRYNAMVRRAREWHFQQGLSPEEIQKKIRKPTHRSLLEIQLWLSSYKGKLK